MAGGLVYLPIFPLPDVTFFPHTFLPLHVFEARYRAMITDCLARDRRLAVVGLLPGYEPIYQGKPPVQAIAGAGCIVRCERQASGRFNIVLRGECRIRIEREMPSDTLYRIVQARELSEVIGDRAGLVRLAGAVRERCLRIFQALGRDTKDMRESLEAVRSAGQLGDQVSAAVLSDATVRQALLEELDVERRLERLTAALDALLRQLPRGQRGS